MRKNILAIVLVIIGILFFLIMFCGFKLGNFKINSYKEIQLANTERKKILSELNYKNLTEFAAKKNALISAVDAYRLQKSQYDTLVEEGQIQEGTVYDSMELYDVDFLWTTIGNYATQKGVTLQFDVVESPKLASISSEYVICDLNFTITGEYIAITDFIYSLENDDKLNFEISKFLMEKGGENLQATFVVKEVAVNSKNLITVPTTPSDMSITN